MFIIIIKQLVIKSKGNNNSYDHKPKHYIFCDRGKSEINKK